MVMAPSATFSCPTTGEILEPQLSEPTHRKCPDWLFLLAASRMRLPDREKERESTIGSEAQRESTIGSDRDEAIRESTIGSDKVEAIRESTIGSDRDEAQRSTKPRS